MFSPKENAEKYVSTAINKANLSTKDTLLLAIMAGIFIACGGIASSVASATIENPSIAKLISGCIFPLGLIMVLICGSELFTGDCLIIIGCLEKKISFLKLLRNWGLVLLGNCIGALIFSLILVYSHTPDLFNGELAKYMVSIANTKCGLSFTDTFLRGILCNLLVCLAVWGAGAAKDVTGKVLFAFWPVMAFVICGFEHCVANFYYIFAGMFTKIEYGIVAENISFANFIKNIIPATLGNIVGGAIFVGFMYWLIYLKKDN